MPRKSPLLTAADAKNPSLLADALRILERQPMLPSFTVAQAQAIDTTGLEKGCQIYVTNETGGAVPAFFDGTNWRRVTDRAVIS